MSPQKRLPIPEPAVSGRRLRRVVIEERQRKTLDHARVAAGYDEDVDPYAHDSATFRLVNQRKQLDLLPEADHVVPALDEWKHWSKMKDWDSRNRLLEDLIGRLRRREATAGEIQFLVVICRPVWATVAASLRRYGGVDLDPTERGPFDRQEVRRVNELDRSELDQVVQHALFDALLSCPREFPRRFFPWLKDVLAHRALDHVRRDLGEHALALAPDTGIKEALDNLLTDEAQPAASFYRAPGSPAHSQWLRTLDLPEIFSIADEYSSYARTQSACERAVDRLPNRQREVVRDRYYNAMSSAKIADAYGLAPSSVRNSHSGALRNLRADDGLFEVLEAVGIVRDHARRAALSASARDAA